MSESDSASQSSYSAGGGGAVAESADARQLNDFNERNDNDLLEQSRTLEDAVFASFFTLSKNRSTTDLRWTAARVLLEFLQLFRVVFNSTLAWKINRDLWVWKAFYWVLFRLVVLPKGYGTYIAVFYVLAVVILVCMVATVWAAVVLKKDESGSTWLRRMVAVLQLVALVLYSIFWVAVLDYMAVLFNCNWAEATSAQGAHHMSFTSYNCLAMPHLAHMCFALVMIVLFCGVTLCMSVSSCERNPLARGHLASPMAAAALRMTLLKIAMVLLSTACGQFGRMQPVLMLICASLITCFMLRSLPFFYDAVNHLWVGLWCGIVFTCCMLVAITYTVNKRPAALQLTYREDMTFAVLYGIFPAVLLGALLSAAWMRWRRRPLAELAAAFAAQASSSAVNLKDVHRFRDSVEAEFLMRTMRKWDEDGVPDPATMQFGEFIIRCAMARLPNQPALLTLYSHFLVDARRDGQTARTQLQLAVKASPSLFDRYFIYACTEAGKKLKSESDGLDLLGYVEYQRSYRACVRAHKLALQAQRQFWHCLLRDSVSFKDLQDGLDNMAKAERQATAVYRRVMERYPTNGKLLKIYGRFLEYVRHDPWGASKFYDEAMKQGTSESLMALAGQGSSGAGSDAASRIAGLMGPVDEKNDTIIIINAAGIIMMVNGAGYRLYGYEKGELEGKNISMLMPHPFSNRHNSFLQHYLMTGESRIMNSIRQVVALHKDRSVFPVSLVVTKLSGVGSDSIFMGVQRSHVLEDDGSVKVWATTNGLLLCCDERFEDTFGVAPRDVVGRSLASMTVDEEGFGKWVAAAMELPAEAVLNGAHRLRSKVLHKYLAPIEVEVTVEFGGSDDVRMLLLRLRCLSDSTALLVTDPKGHIQFATSQMAVLVGYSVKVMMDGMNMAGLLPPPYSQLHAAFMKDPSGKLPLSSCRSGAVVHLINASNNKVPVTLQMSQHDDGEHMQHIIKVLPSSEEALLCQQRVLLVLNHRGVVLSVNGAASKGVFGFSPAALVGRPLAAFVNVFTQWSVQHGDDAGLLMSLGLRAQAGRDVVFRAGVHTPFSDAELATALAGSKAGGSGGGGKDATLSALATRHKERPAVVSLTVMQLDENDDERSGGRLDAEATPVLQLELWRAEGLTSVVEMDGKLAISRVEPMLGLIFGTSAHALLHKSFKSLVGLPADTSAPDLLSSSGKKSMLKQGAAWKTGPVRTLETTHMDEAPLNLQVQAVSKDGKSSNKLLALVRLMDSSTGSLQPLLALHKAAVSGADGGAARLVAAPEDAASGSEAGAANDDDGGSSMSSKGGGHAPGGTDGGRPGSPDLHDRLKSRLHVERWVEDSAPFQHCKEGPEAAAPPLQKQLQLQLPPPQQRGTSQPSRRPGPHAGGADDDDAGHAFVQIGVQGSIAKAGRGGGNDDASDAGHSVASGSQQSGDATSEGLDAAGSAAGSDADDELATDWRRAKRLKKLMRMMTSTTAQLASARFNRHTYVLTLILMAAHVVCFVVLLTQVNARYQTAYEVGDMAQAIERSQMASMRANFVQKCASPSYRGLDVCDERHIDEYLDKLLENYHSLRNIHQGLYLGYSTLKHFADTRLMDYWTFAQLPEVLWFQVTENAADVSANSTTSLWEMGNKFLQSMLDVHFNAKQLGYSLSSTPFFHYVYDNGPDSLFSGYAWSLDVMVDYAWVQLDALNKVLVVLLIVEALLVQITTMSYEFLLLRAANCEAMKRFSVFLALPSATVRSMASRQLQVDDDDKSDLEDDELEALNAAGAAETEQQAATSKAGDAKQSKSVRMSVVGGGDDDDAPAAKKKGGRQASTGRAGTKSAAASKPCKTLWQQLNKRLFGWMSTTFKVNGKKLMPHSSVLWRFMVPLLLWVSAVIVMFGVSFQMLQGLQAPLSSLNAAAHVRFRIARCRVTANMFGFAETTEEIVFWRGRLREELVLLKHEYTALIYGGRIEPVAQGLSYNPSTPAAAFANSAFSKIFFKTTNCLRHDQSGCYGPESPWFDITHTGLDAMVTRYMDEMSVFANLPDALAYPNHTSYSYVTHVGGQDMYDGLATAAGLFVKYTISKFESVKQLHIILLVVTLLLILLFVAKLLRPYTHKLHSQSKAMAGMMSLLPAEVDIESHVKSLVLGIRRDALSSSMHMDAATAGAAINAASGGGGGATVLAIGAPGGVSAAALGGSRFSAGGGASAGGSPHAAPAVKGRPSWRQAEEEAEDEGEGEEDEE